MISTSARASLSSSIVAACRFTRASRWAIHSSASARIVRSRSISAPALASGCATACSDAVVRLALHLLTRRSMRTARATAPNKPANVIHVAKPISPQTMRCNSVAGRVRNGSVRVLQGRARPCGSLSQRGVRHSHRVTHLGLHGGCHLVLVGGAFWRMFLGPLAYPGAITPHRWESQFPTGGSRITTVPIPVQADAAGSRHRQRSGSVGEHRPEIQPPAPF